MTSSKEQGDCVIPLQQVVSVEVTQVETLDRYSTELPRDSLMLAHLSSGQWIILAALALGMVARLLRVPHITGSVTREVVAHNHPAEALELYLGLKCRANVGGFIRAQHPGKQVDASRDLLLDRHDTPFDVLDAGGDFLAVFTLQDSLA